MAEIDIGLGKSARQGITLDQVALVPSRRTRDLDKVDLSWQIDAYRVDLPFLTSPMDSVTTPERAGEVDALGGLGVLDLEGVWARHEDPSAALAEVAEMDDVEMARARLRALYDAPVNHDLVTERIKAMHAAGAYAAGSVSPKRVASMADTLLRAELDLLVISGTVISAEHVSDADDTLNLKQFVRELETPVIVGGCASYRAALHLMRTGAAGVLVGIDGGRSATTGSVTGIGSPLATSIADVRAARMRHLDETGVYVHVIADGGLRSGGDIAKAIACGADSVVLGSALAATDGAPGGEWHWGRTAFHPTLPQGDVVRLPSAGTLAEVVSGPTERTDGKANLFGALRQSMAALGFETVKELQSAELVITGG